MLYRPARSTLFPYTTLFRSWPDNCTSKPPTRGCSCARSAGTRCRKRPSRLVNHRLKSARTTSRPSSISKRCSSAITFRNWVDRKSTRLNSSHTVISYAVFCLNALSSCEIYTLSLHDALPILARQLHIEAPHARVLVCEKRRHPVPEAAFKVGESSVEIGAHYFKTIVNLEALLERDHLPKLGRSEEHTSELQSHSDLVCRLLLECSIVLRDLHSFPTRRSSDLGQTTAHRSPPRAGARVREAPAPGAGSGLQGW